MRCRVILQNSTRCGNSVWKSRILYNEFYDVCYAHRKQWVRPTAADYTPPEPERKP